MQTKHTFKHRLADIRRETANLAKGLAEEQARVQLAQDALAAEAELLPKLPATLRVKFAMGASDRWALHVEGPLADALALLPPCNARMRFYADGWGMRFENRPADWTQRVLPLRQSRGSDVICYGHYLADGTLLEVHVQDAKGLPAIEGYVQLTTRGHHVLVREAVEWPLCKGPGDAFHERWNALGDKHGFRAGPKSVAAAFRCWASENKEALTMDMLPIPAATTMEVAGETLVILRSARDRGGAETLPEGSPLHFLPRLGPFWSYFTKDQARELVELVNETRCDLKAVEAAAAQQGFAQAQIALKEFEDQFLSSVVSPVDAVAMQTWLRLRTGLPIVVLTRLPAHHPGLGQVELHLALWNNTATALLNVPAGLAEDGFDFQDPPYGQYKDNAGHF